MFHLYKPLIRLYHMILCRLLITVEADDTLLISSAGAQGNEAGSLTRIWLQSSLIIIRFHCWYPKQPDRLTITVTLACCLPESSIYCWYFAVHQSKPSFNILMETYMSSSVDRTDNRTLAEIKSINYYGFWLQLNTR